MGGGTTLFLDKFYLKNVIEMTFSARIKSSLLGYIVGSKGEREELLSTGFIHPGISSLYL